MSRTLSAAEGWPSAGCAAVESTIGVCQTALPVGGLPETGGSGVHVPFTTTPFCWSNASPSPNQMVTGPPGVALGPTANAPTASEPSVSVSGVQVGALLLK